MLSTFIGNGTFTLTSWQFGLARSLLLDHGTQPRGAGPIVPSIGRSGNSLVLQFVLARGFPFGPGDRLKPDLGQGHTEFKQPPLPNAAEE